LGFGLLKAVHVYMNENFAANAQTVSEFLTTASPPFPLFPRTLPTIITTDSISIYRIISVTISHRERPVSRSAVQI
jgi:hypothetical protein